MMGGMLMEGDQSKSIPMKSTLHRMVGFLNWAIWGKLWMRQEVFHENMRLNIYGTLFVLMNKFRIGVDCKCYAGRKRDVGERTC